MRTLPVFLDLQGRRALVLGSGEVAERKADALRRAGAVVELAARFDPALLQGCAIAIGADADEAELAALSAAAQAAGIPINVVDRPALCSFITPSVIDRDPLLVAVSTGGAAPVLARLVRARIEALIPPAWGRLAALADSLKAEIRRALPDTVLRRRLLERTLGGRVADLVFAGQDDAARDEMLREVAAARDGADGVAGGIVYLVGAGPGAADLLTLRAHRLMGEADVIVHGACVTGEVLDMARRDAGRVLVCEQEAAALLVHLGREGRKVVRLRGRRASGRDAEAEALEAAGVACEVVPGA